MNVHRPFLDEDMITPNLIKQLSATVYALGVRHEEMQQAKFGRSKVKRPVSDTHLDVYKRQAIPLANAMS